jgi:hypothetical protein
LTRKTPLLICSMRTAIPYPCMGSSASVLRMSMSSAPWTRSPDLSAIWRIPLTIKRKNTPPLHLIVKRRSSKNVPDRGAEPRASRRWEVGRPLKGLPGCRAAVARPFSATRECREGRFSPTSLGLADFVRRKLAQGQDSKRKSSNFRSADHTRTGLLLLKQHHCRWDCSLLLLSHRKCGILPVGNQHLSLWGTRSRFSKVLWRS